MEENEQLDDYTESDGNNSTIEYGITEAAVPTKRGVERCSFSTASETISTSSISLSSVESGSMSSLSRAGSSLRSSMTQYKSKAWMKESQPVFGREDDILEEDENDEDPSSCEFVQESSRKTSAGHSKPDSLSDTARARSIRIEKSIRHLKASSRSPLMKSAYYMSQLREFSLDEEGRCCPEIVELGGIEVVISAMHYQLDHSDDQEPPVSRPTSAGESELSSDDDDSMDDDPNDPVFRIRILQLGISFLANMARDPELCQTIVAAGAVEVLEHAMESYPDNANLQEKACDAFGTLARQVRESVETPHVVQHILNAMRQNRSDRFVQRRACVALYRLAGGLPAPCSAMGEAGAVQQVLQTMQAQKDDPKTQRLCFGVLKSLCKRVDANKGRVVSGGGLQTLVYSMRRYEEAADVQEEACRLFGYLTICHSERKFTIVRTGGLDCVLAAMKKHPENNRLQVAGCAVLLNLTSKVKLAQAANSHGALRVVRDTAVKHCPQEAGKLVKRLRVAKFAPILFAS